MAERPETLPRTREKKRALTPIEQTLSALGARPPSADEVAAMRALTRGTADSGQQRRAMNYILVELCGVGRVTFAGEATHAAAFRSGSQGVGVAVAQIADAVVMTFPKAVE